MSKGYRIHAAPLAHLPAPGDTRPILRIPDAPSYRKYGAVYMPDNGQPMQGLLSRAVIRCARCGSPITPGSIFTKHSIPRRGRLGPQPCCWHCVPFMVP